MTPSAPVCSAAITGSGPIWATMRLQSSTISSVSHSGRRGVSTMRRAFAPWRSLRLSHSLSISPLITAARKFRLFSRAISWAMRRVPSNCGSEPEGLPPEKTKGIRARRAAVRIRAMSRCLLALPT